MKRPVTPKPRPIVKLHPLATWNTLHRAELSLKKISNLEYFTLFSDLKNNEFKSTYLNKGECPFVDVESAMDYLNFDTEHHVFLAIGDMDGIGEEVLAKVMVLIPGEEPIFYDGEDFYYDNIWEVNKFVQNNTVHPVRDGKFWDLQHFLVIEDPIGTDIDDLPIDLFHRIDSGATALQAIATNSYSQVLGYDTPEGRAFWQIDSHRLDRFE